MVRVTALDIQARLRNPMALLEDSMTSVTTLYIKGTLAEYTLSVKRNLSLFQGDAH